MAVGECPTLINRFKERKFSYISYFHTVGHIYFLVLLGSINGYSNLIIVIVYESQTLCFQFLTQEFTGFSLTTLSMDALHKYRY